MNYEQFLEQMKEQHAENLREMPLPPGVEEHVQKMIGQGDKETLIFMLKLAWIFGVQYGQASNNQTNQQESGPSPIQA